MPRFVAPAVLLACSAWAGAWALDDDFGGFSDLRLNLHAYGIGYDVTYLNSTEKDNFDATYRAGVTWIASLGLAPRRGGLLIGLGFNYGIMDGELTNGVGVNLQSWALQGYAGWGWQLRERIQIEVLPMLAFGRAHLRLDNSVFGLADFTGADSLREVGLMTNLVWTHPNGIQLGGTLGYLLSRSTITDDVAGIEFDWDTANFTLGFIFGARL